MTSETNTITWSPKPATRFSKNQPKIWEPTSDTIRTPIRRGIKYRTTEIQDNFTHRLSSTTIALTQATKTNTPLPCSQTEKIIYSTGKARAHWNRDHYGPPPKIAHLKALGDNLVVIRHMASAITAAVNAWTRNRWCCYEIGLSISLPHSPRLVSVPVLFPPRLLTSHNTSPATITLSLVHLNSQTT